MSAGFTQYSNEVYHSLAAMPRIDRAVYMAIYLGLCVAAKWKEAAVTVGRTSHTLLPGEAWFTVRGLAETVGTSKSKVESGLGLLEKCGWIKIRPFGSDSHRTIDETTDRTSNRTSGSIATITHWGTYRSTVEPDRTSDRTVDRTISSPRSDYTNTEEENTKKDSSQKSAVDALPEGLVEAARYWNDVVAVRWGKSRVKDKTLHGVAKTYLSVEAEMRTEHPSWSLRAAIELAVVTLPGLQGQTWFQFKPFFFMHRYQQKNENLWTGFYESQYGLRGTNVRRGEFGSGSPTTSAASEAIARHFEGVE